MTRNRSLRLFVAAPAAFALCLSLHSLAASPASASPASGSPGSGSPGSGALAAGLASAALAADSGRTYDGGTLDGSYFGGDRRWVDTKRVDYLWVADGFSIEGRTFHVRPWDEPEFLGEDAEDRDGADRRLARQMTPEVPQALVDMLGHTWRGQAEVSTEAGDILVDGRIVDCSTGSKAAKMLVGFGAGAGFTTFDMKFTDAATGELVAALHHRVVSGTTWSTTDSKFIKWMERFGEQVAKHGFAGLYADGDEVDD